jgi:hypothetical protein
MSWLARPSELVMSPDKLLVILLSGFDDALYGGTRRAEGCHEGVVLTAQDNYVRARLVEVVAERGKPELLHLSSFRFRHPEESATRVVGR